jgi:hypothetical protein
MDVEVCADELDLIDSFAEIVGIDEREKEFALIASDQL